MIIKWLDDAAQDLHQLRHYIAENNPYAAQSIAERIIEAVSLLAEQPGLGRPGRVPQTRELVITGTPFIIPYQVRGNVVEILRVFHGAMLWPDKLP
ncbi:MAG: toxin Y4kP [Gammaproteobacteria bacterium]|jgi:toxin ParE1/3/4|nr:toxin Y4kP [Gammaproteobacteria bacterium]